MTNFQGVTEFLQRSRERLLDGGGLKIGAYADALSAVAVIELLEPRQILELFFHSRKSWILHKLATSFANPTFLDAVAMFSEVLKAIQVTVVQVGELFLQVSEEMPLFYKVILSSPPASELFGGIPNPDKEVRLWKSFRDELGLLMTLLEKPYKARTCLNVLKDIAREIVNKIGGSYLKDAISSGGEIALVEKLIRETMDSREALERSFDWLKSVFGSEIELPWSRIRELVLEADLDLWDEIFEDAFVQRMKSIIDSGFGNLTRDANIAESVHTIVGTPGEQVDFRAYLRGPSTGGGVWFIGPNDGKSASSRAQAKESSFQTCLSAYFGPEVNRIRDAVDDYCQRALEELRHFLESPKAATRLKKLAKYLQDRCYESLSSILVQLKGEVDSLCTAL